MLTTPVKLDNSTKNHNNAHGVVSSVKSVPIRVKCRRLGMSVLYKSISISLVSDTPDSLEYVLVRDGHWSTGGQQLTQWSISIRNVDSRPVCGFVVCIDPASLRLSDYWGLIPLAPGWYDLFKSPYWLRMQPNDTYSAGFVTIDDPNKAVLTTSSLQICRTDS